MVDVDIPVYVHDASVTVKREYKSDVDDSAVLVDADTDVRSVSPRRLVLISLIPSASHPHSTPAHVQLRNSKRVGAMEYLFPFLSAFSAKSMSESWW